MFKQHYNNYFQDVKLVTSDGDSTSFHNIISEDRVVIFSMFYSTCQLKCIPSGRIFARANKLLGPLSTQNNIYFCMITLNASDTNQDMKEFKDAIATPVGRVACDDDRLINFELYRANGLQETEQLRKSLGMVIEDNLKRDEDIVEHIPKYVLVNNHVGQVRHIAPFRNPIDICRSLIQFSHRQFGSQTWAGHLKYLRYNILSNDELYENSSTISQRYTLPFLPQKIKEQVLNYAKIQGGIMTPLKNDRVRFYNSKNCNKCPC